jgi:sulfane dehydrogenase subunit SoxC
MSYKTHRRGFLTAAASTLGASLLTPGTSGARELGAGRSGYSDRSKYERSERFFTGSTPGTGSGRTPLADQPGIITPSSLHFERHHSGIPDIDPARHELMLHGLVDRPLVFTMSELRRLPSVSRIHFLECAGNSGREHEGRPAETVQKSHGLLSCSEWTGVPLRVLFEQAGVKTKAGWVVAEGADASRLNRSIPMAKALDDVIVAYGQNGEALRPSQGYPLRLLVPGWEGNVSIKWLGRLQVTSEPYMTRDEAAFYTDLLPDGKARRFTFVMEAKSVITRPSGGQRLDGPGFYEISGLAWSGRGRIARVEVSTDEGRSWQDAELDGPVLSKAATRFRLPWRWQGEETSLQSRCTDETGYVQPTREMLLAVRGKNASDHYNGIKQWFIHKDGAVSHA